MPNYKVLTSLGLVFMAITLSAQNNNLSPFSRFGLGDLQNLGASSQRSLGGTGFALTHDRQINLLNPNAALELPGPIFNVNLLSNFTTISGKDFERKQSYTGLNSVAFAFPIKKMVAFQFGLRPYSSVNYDLNSTTTIGQDTVATNYQGTGGLNDAFLAVSHDFLHKKDSTTLALSIQIDHLFGPIRQNRTLYTDVVDNGYGIKDTRLSNLSSTSPSFAALYKKYIGKDDAFQISLAANYQPKMKLSGNQELFSYTFLRNFGGLESGKDTINYSASEKNTVSVPQKVGFGIAFAYKDKLQVGMDYSVQNWSEFTQNLSTTKLEGVFTDLRRLSFGAHYTPSLNILFNAPIWNFITYSAGVWTSKGYLEYNGAELEEFGTSFGLRIPFRKSRSNSAIQIGMEYSLRGSVESNLLKEQNTRLIFGLSLSPNFIDRWFYKRKYD